MKAVAMTVKTADSSCTDQWDGRQNVKDLTLQSKAAALSAQALFLCSNSKFAHKLVEERSLTGKFLCGSCALLCGRGVRLNNARDLLDAR